MQKLALILERDRLLSLSPVLNPGGLKVTVLSWTTDFGAVRWPRVWKSQRMKNEKDFILKWDIRAALQATSYILKALIYYFSVPLPAESSSLSLPVFLLLSSSPVLHRLFRDETVSVVHHAAPRSRDVSASSLPLRDASLQKVPVQHLI